jgi:membrane protein YdbS with pleckstrin-like domain
MLTTDEERFVDYWKKNREQEKRTFRQLVIGLPIGLTFAIAILAIFSSGWYERANMVAYSSSSPFIFVFAIVVIIGFVAIFSKKHRWDMNEQRYLELRHKQNNSITKAAAEPAKQSTDNN